VSTDFLENTSKPNIKNNYVEQEIPKNSILGKRPSPQKMTIEELEEGEITPSVRYTQINEELKEYEQAVENSYDPKNVRKSISSSKSFHSFNNLLNHKSQ